MSYDQKPARVRVVAGTPADRGRSPAGGPLNGGFAAGPAPRRPGRARPAGAKQGIGPAMIAILFLSAALIGGAVQAWLLLRP